MGRTLDPSGSAWSVKRRWLPRREPLFRRIPKPVPRSDDAQAGHEAVGSPTFTFFGELFAEAPVLLLVAVVLGLALLLLPVFALIIEALIVAVLLTVTAVANVVLRRPWVIEAARDDGSETRHWKVSGWSRSGEAVHQVQRAIASGVQGFQTVDVRRVDPA